MYLLEWITENGYVWSTVNRKMVCYKTSQYHRVFLTNEQLIEIYERTHL
jgi:hypothetical protein